MAAAAAAYCDWIESLPAPEGETAQPAEVEAAGQECARQARSHLLLVLSAGSALVEPPLEDEAPSYKVSNAAWIDVYRRTAALPLGYYHEVSGAIDAAAYEEPAPAIGDAGDDLADVWRDLKEGMLAWEAGDHRGAAWTWHFGFEVHWGYHAVDVLRQIHWWLSKNKRPDVTDAIDR